MIKGIIVKNYLGEELTIELGNPSPEHGLIIKSIDGLDGLRTNINVTEIASMDGGKFNSARAEKRDVNILFYLVGAPEVEDSRHIIYKYFPAKKPVMVFVETDRRTVFFEGFVQSSETEIFSEQEVSTVNIVCPNPYLYDAFNLGYNSEEFSFINKSFTFPFEGTEESKNLEMSILKSRLEKTIDYRGDIETGVLFKIDMLGKPTDFVLYNATTRTKVSIKITDIETIVGREIATGDILYLSSEYSKKAFTFVSRGKKYNIINALGRNPDWITLHKGLNTIVCIPLSNPENLYFTVMNRVIYEGI